MADESMSNTDDINTVDPDEAEQIAAQKIINEEYKVWKKHAIFLYDCMMSKALEWPTLTTQWFPDVRKPADDPNHQYHRLLYGTNTGNEAEDYLVLSEVKLPHVMADPKNYNPESREIGGHGGAQHAQGEMKFEVKQKIRHPGEVNKARYMWQNPDLIATMCIDGRCLVWDRTKHPSMPSGDKISPQIELVGHKSEGFGLHWSPMKEGLLATGANDNTVKVWNIQDYSKGHLKPSQTYSHHSAPVNDVQFHPSMWFALAAVSDDKTLSIIDRRTDKNPYMSTEAHSDNVNTVAWNPAREPLLATGSEDSTIALWDLRMLDRKVHSMEAHRGSVSKLEWHPHPNLHYILASSSKDRRIHFWDLSAVGKEQSPEDAEDGPPELLFMHGGHTNHVADFNFNKNLPWLMVSAADDNLIQIWRTTQTLLEVDNAEVTTEELE